MSDMRKKPMTPNDAVLDGGGAFDRGRRQALKAGAILVPTIVTLHATPAWAQTDYTMTAYRYGDHAGMCRNPNYNPQASPDSSAGREFTECPRNDKGGGRRTHDLTGEDYTGESSGGLTEIQIK